MTDHRDPNATHRHAYHAFEDFERLRREPWNEHLWHSVSHHLRHTVWRTCLDVPRRKRHYVRRSCQ